MKFSEWPVVILLVASGVLAASPERKIKFYRNPMDPSITSKVPAKDNMGMDYIPVYEDSPKPAEKQSPAPKVSGRAEVTLDDTRFRLSGAALSTVVRKDLESLIPVSGRATSASRVSLQIPERELSELKPGMEVELQSPSVGARKLMGRVASLSSILDPMTRSLSVEVQLDSPAPGLRSESSVFGSVHIRKKNVLVVPEGAIVRLAEGAHVYVVDQRRPEAKVLVPRSVRLGLRGQEQVEVTEGLAEGEMISSGPNFLIDSESRIQDVHD